MKQPATVELFYDGVWNAAPVYARDAITITHGRSDSESNDQVGECRLMIDNRSEAYHPRNANSPLFGKIGRNTPLRVRLGAADIRFAGEVTAWAPDRSPRFVPGAGIGDAWVAVTAKGVSSRLGQGATPLRSAPYRYATTLQSAGSNAAPIAYWPLDELSRATFGTPGLGRYAFKLRRRGSSAIKPAEGELAPWLPNGVQVNETTLGTALDALVIKPPDARVAMDVAYAGDKLGVFSFSVFSRDGLSIWRVRFDPATSDLSIRFKADGENSSETTLSNTTYTPAFDAELHVARLDLLNSGSDVLARVYIDGVLALTGTKGTLANAGVSKVRLAGTTGSGSSAVHFGHVAVWSAGGILVPYPPEDYAAAVNGHPGEPAGRRIERLCSQNGVAFTSTGSLDDTAALGPQHADKLLDTLREAADTDVGILYDALPAVGLHYRTRVNRYNQAAALTLSFAGGQVAPPLAPAVDDLDVRNDVTVTRRDGGSVRAVLASGRMSTQGPPAGVGTYDTQPAVNVPGDGKFLEDQAGWRLHLGTVDEDRFPQVSIDLDANPELAAAVAALRAGDRLAVTNLPDHVCVNDLSLVIEGWTETLGTHRRVVAFNCSPETPWRVLVYQSAAGATVHKYDTGGSSLASLVTAAATSLSVATATAHPIWTTAAGEMGFDIECEGERMTVTNITGGSSPQTFTVVRAVNGVVKGHPAAAPIKLWQTPVYAL